MSDAIVGIGTDLSALVREFKKIPTTAEGPLRELLIKTEKTAQNAAKAAKRAVKSTSREARRAARAAERAQRDAQEGMKGLVELTGVSADRFDKLGKVIGALSTPLGMATVAATGVGLAVAGLGAGIVGAVAAADELVDELEGLRSLEGFGVSAAAIASIEEANAAMASLGMIAKRGVVVLAAEWAPAVAQATDLLVRFGLMGLDALEKIAQGEGLLRSLAIYVTDQFVRAFTAPITAIMEVVGTLGTLADAVGADGLGEALKGAEASWDGFTRGIAATAVDAYIDLTADAVEGVADATADYEDRAAALIGTVGRLTEAEHKLTAAEKAAQKARESRFASQAKQLEQIADVVADAARVQAFERELAALDPGGPTADQVARWRELGDSVDALVPPEARDRLLDLELLLINLQIAATEAGEGNAELQRQIERVEGAIAAAELDEEARQLAEETERAAERAEQLAARWETVGRVISGVGAVVGGIASAADALTGGALGSLGSVEGVLGVAGDEETGAGDAVSSMADQAVGFVERVAEQLPELVDRLLEELPRVFDAVIAAVPDIVQALASQLPELLGMLAEKLPELAAALVAELPTVVDAVVKSIPTVIRGLIKGLPALFDAIFAAIPEIVVAVIRGIPDIVGAVVEAVPVIAVSLVESIFTELIPQLPRIVVELVKAAPRMALEFVQSIAQFFADVINEIITLGAKKTKTFGDTPGPVRVGADGLLARFSPGDVVIAARDTEGVRRQLPPAPSAAPAPAPMASRASLDLRRGHVWLDGVLERNLASGGTLARVGGGTVGQTRVFQ